MSAIDSAPVPHDSLGRQIAMTAKHTRRWVDERFAEHGASLVTWIVLRHAQQAEPPGFSQRELAADMSIGGPSLVRHLDRLEAEGLVARERDPHDRRVTRVALTPKGRRRYDELAEVAAATDEDLRRLMTDDEAETVLTVLARIEHHLSTDSRSEIA